MTIVVDASVVVAALVDTGPDGRWAQHLIATEWLAAPHLIEVETANVLRRAAAAGAISDDIATLAHADLVALPIDLFPYEAFAERIWALRHNLTTGDAWYVAIAEALHVPLATLDQRLRNAAGPACEFASRR